MNAPRLFVLPLSPWSERARWALDHHGVAYETVVHTPFLGERRLRRVVGAGAARATVPVLQTGTELITESWDIALYGDRVGAGSKLVPAERQAEVRRWVDLADKAMGAGRVLVVAASAASPGALDESFPPEVPRALRPLLRPVARYGMRWFAAKYGLNGQSAEEARAEVREALQTLRSALDKSGPCLLGAFSYADIVMAVCLQGILPVDGKYIPLGPATREAWTQKMLAEDFVDLLAWRDRLYERHRLTTSPNA